MTAPRLQLALPEPLERLVPRTSRGLVFGIPALDAALPWGVPRGQLTALDAQLGSGGTALLLSLAEATLKADEAVAFVDAERSLAPLAAAHLASIGSFWVVRPKGAQSAWWCADVVLRTGAFGLVIVDQPLAPARHVALRLQRLARDRDAALVARCASVPRCPCASLHLSVRSIHTGFTPGPWGNAWPSARTLQVTIERGGAPRAAEVLLGIPLPDRLRPHWAVRDRCAGRTSRRAHRARH